MRISDWSSDVCSSDLVSLVAYSTPAEALGKSIKLFQKTKTGKGTTFSQSYAASGDSSRAVVRSEEHTSELQSLMRISYAVFCLKKKNKIKHKAEHANES